MKRHFTKQTNGTIRCTLCRQDFTTKQEFGSHCIPRQDNRGRGANLCKAA
jgi:hypothetical protein